MKVKQLLHKFSPGPSSISQAEVLNVKTGERTCYRDELLSEDFGESGELNVNSFTVIENKMLIYVQ